MIILYLFTYSLSAEGWKNYKDPDVPQLPNLCTIKGQQIYELIKILFFVEKVQFLNLYGKIISTKISFIVIFFIKELAKIWREIIFEGALVSQENLDRICENNIYLYMEKISEPSEPFHKCQSLTCLDRCSLADKFIKIA